MLRVGLLLVCAMLLHAADITLDCTGGIGSPLVVTVRVANAPAFAESTGIIRFDNTRLSLAAQAPGTFVAFRQDSRTQPSINASGEVRFGTLDTVDNAVGAGTLGIFTFSVLADGPTTLTSAEYGSSEPFGCLLQAQDGTSIPVTLIGLPVTANVTVASNAAPSISSAGALPSVVTGTQTALHITATDDGGEPALTYIWEVQTAPAGGGATFSPNNANTAKASTATFSAAGTYVLRAKALDSAPLTTFQDVTVLVNQTGTAVVISPSAATLAPTEMQAFTAQVNDQFNTALIAQPSVTWALDMGGSGSITTSGVYVAPSTIGTSIVRAAAGSLSGIATVTVTAGGTTPSPNPSASELIDGQQQGGRDCGAGNVAVLLCGVFWLTFRRRR